MPPHDRVQYRCNLDAVCTHPAGEPCAAGSAGYSDIAEGAQVKVTNGSGEVVACGSLSGGESATTPDIWEIEGDYPRCAFAYIVSNVPDSGDIYGVEISHRGVIQFSKADAQTLAFSLGD